MRPISEMLDVGGSPAENAAIALIMLSRMAITPQTDSKPVDSRSGRMMANARAISTGAIDKAVLGGFTGATEFRLLVTADQLLPRMESLAREAIHLAGGPDQFFDLVELAAAPPAPRWRYPMITALLVHQMKLGELAMDLWRAQEAAANARHAYHQAIADYERQHGHLDKLIRKNDPDHAAVREFTAPKYKLLQQAKRRVYALKIRMAKACAKLARIAAASPTKHESQK